MQWTRRGCEPAMADDRRGEGQGQMRAEELRSLISAPIECRLDCYRLLATWLKTPLRLVPTVPMTTTAATAISAAIRPYSMAVTPRLSLIRQRKNWKLRILGVSPLTIDPQKLCAH